VGDAFAAYNSLFRSWIYKLEPNASTSKSREILLIAIDFFTLKRYHIGNE